MNSFIACTSTLSSKKESHRTQTWSSLTSRSKNKLPDAILPPVRFLYIFSGYVWHSLFGDESLEALRSVAAFFSVLTLLLGVIFAWRLRGSKWALGIGALMAFAPTQIHMSQHAFIDGVFTFWALLCLWLFGKTCARRKNGHGSSPTDLRSLSSLLPRKIRFSFGSLSSFLF